MSSFTAQDMPSLLAERDTHVQLIKNNLAAAQTRIKHQADKNRVDSVGTLNTGYPHIQALIQDKEQGVHPRTAT
jgi:hypothetical protein